MSIFTSGYTLPIKRTLQGVDTMARILDGHELQPAIDKLILEKKSSRQISKFCKENGLLLSHMAISEYINDNKDRIQLGVREQVEKIRQEAIEEGVSTQVFLQAVIKKGYDKLLAGDYDDASLKDIISAARILMPLQVEADVNATISMEDVIKTLSMEDKEDVDK